MRCVSNGDTLECLVPSNCLDYGKILGIEKKHLIDKLVNYVENCGLKTKYFRKFTFIYSDSDKLYVFLSIYLSRNTDYYRNTVNWIKLIIENNCLGNLNKCLSIINSYQYRELIGISKTTDLNKIVELNSVDLLKKRGVGLKTVNAYILHAYGFTEYAPIDRHYFNILKHIGLNGVIPIKTLCIRNKLDCLKCFARNHCLYYITRSRFSVFNGVIQSMIYVYSRLKKIADSKLKLSELEANLLSSIGDRYNDLVDEFEKIIDILTSFDYTKIS